jgi:hypothetical protein
MDAMRLDIDGVTVPIGEMHLFTLRFYQKGGSGIGELLTIEPTLYMDGKRVTRCWRMVMDISILPDEHGGNANTQ